MISWIRSKNFTKGWLLCWCTVDGCLSIVYHVLKLYIKTKWRWVHGSPPPPSTSSNQQSLLSNTMRSQTLSLNQWTRFGSPDTTKLIYMLIVCVDVWMAWYYTHSSWMGAELLVIHNLVHLSELYTCIKNTKFIMNSIHSTWKVSFVPSPRFPRGKGQCFIQRVGCPGISHP